MQRILLPSSTRRETEFGFRANRCALPRLCGGPAVICRASWSPPTSDGCGITWAPGQDLQVWARSHPAGLTGGAGGHGLQGLPHPHAGAGATTGRRLPLPDR